MERRNFVKAVSLTTGGIMLAPNFGVSQIIKENNDNEIIALYEELISIWSNALLYNQVNNIQTGLHGGLLCPACGVIHGRCLDAVYPFMYMAEKTGTERYLQGAIDVMKWSNNVFVEKVGAYANDMKASWKGISAFGAISIGEALRYHHAIIPADVKSFWMQRLEALGNFLYGFMRKEISNINYPVTSCYSLALIGHLTGQDKFFIKAKELSQLFGEHITENNLLYGEGKPYAKKSAKGLPPIDLGYNVEETLSGVAMYAELVNDTELKQLASKVMKAHIEFMLPDGAWDNSWGTRSYKWTYWGSRTTVGAHAALHILGASETNFARAAYLNTHLMKQSTGAEGLLAGGPHYQSHGVPPCIHHTFCHAKSLAHALNRKELLQKQSIAHSIPREGSYGIKTFKELDTHLFANKNWKATLTGYDWMFYGNGTHVRGGALSLLWNAKVGPVLTTLLAFLIVACGRHNLGEQATLTTENNVIYSTSFNVTNSDFFRWKQQGSVIIQKENDNSFLSIENLVEGDSVFWKQTFKLHQDWKRVKIEGRVRIPHIVPKALFGKSARIFTAIRSQDDELLTFIGDISFTNLTWRGIIEDWQYFSHEVNLPVFVDKGTIKGLNKLEVSFELNEALGTLQLDDLKITAVKPKDNIRDYNINLDTLLLKRLPIAEIGCKIKSEDEAKIENFLYVDKNSNIIKSDGSEKHPYTSIKEAIHKALSSEMPTKILIKRGSYSEEILISVAERTLQPLLVIEGVEEGVVITGAKRLEEWENIDGTTYAHKWNYNFEHAEQIWAGKGPWGNSGKIEEEGLSKETLFVNNTRLNQVFKIQSLENRSFFIDSLEQKILLNYDYDISNANIEAGVLGNLLNVSNKKNLILRNLTFEKAAKHVPFGSVELSFCENVLIENCKFLNSNTTGLLLNYVKDVTVKNSVSNYNGWNGFKVEYGESIKSVNNEFSYNGWRANMGGINGWDLAGNKNFNIHNYYLANTKIYDNRGEGLWFDWCNSNITIENVDIVSNYGCGLYWEASQGPCSLSNSRISNNGKAGVRNAEATFLTVDSCEIFNNRDSQLEARIRLRSATDLFSKPNYVFSGSHLTFKNSILQGGEYSKYLVKFYTQKDSARNISNLFYKTYNGYCNSFYHTAKDNVFVYEKFSHSQDDDNYVKDWQNINFKEWSKYINESESRWELPKIPKNIIIKGLPKNHILEINKSYELSTSPALENMKILKFGVKKLKEKDDVFKFFLNDYQLQNLNSKNQLNLELVEKGSYSLIVFGYTKNNKLVQSDRMLVQVK